MNLMISFYRVALSAFAALLLGACSADSNEADVPSANARGAEPAVVEAAPTVTNAAENADPCSIDIEAGDSLAFSTNSLSVPSTCSEVSVTLTHTGQLPAAAMGHNWVLVPEDAVAEVAQAGMSAGLAGSYVPAGDERVIAATRIIGGGESDTVRFSLDALDAETNYVYVCTFPGHWSIMKGTFSISN